MLFVFTIDLIEFEIVISVIYSLFLIVVLTSFLIKGLVRNTYFWCYTKS